MKWSELCKLEWRGITCDKRSMKWFLLLLSLFALASCAPTQSDGKIRYVCHCGPDCDCGTVSDEPGKCACGEYLVPE